jgi:hypothetical protein
MMMKSMMIFVLATMSNNAYQTKANPIIDGIVDAMDPFLSDLGVSQATIDDLGKAMRMMDSTVLLGLVSDGTFLNADGKPNLGGIAANDVVQEALRDAKLNAEAITAELCGIPSVACPTTTTTTSTPEPAPPPVDTTELISTLTKIAMALNDDVKSSVLSVIATMQNNGDLETIAELIAKSGELDASTFMANDAVTSALEDAGVGAATVTELQSAAATADDSSATAAFASIACVATFVAMFA